jgi:ATP-binding cassette, subfamily B (MDR/TAP), member 1
LKVFSAVKAAHNFQYVPNASKGFSAVTNIIHQLESRPKVDAEAKGGIKMVPGDANGHVLFEKVSFSYPTRPDNLVLSELNLDIQPGTL